MAIGSLPSPLRGLASYGALFAVTVSRDIIAQTRTRCGVRVRVAAGSQSPSVLGAVSYRYG